MIEKIKSPLDLKVGNYKGTEFDIIPADTFAMVCRKTNELVDAVNNIVSVQEKLVDCFVVKTKQEAPVDKYAEQRKWIGKLCWFWNEDTEEDKRCKVFSGIRLGDDYKYYDCDCIKWKHCEPVKPNDDIIYKGEQQ